MAFKATIEYTRPEDSAVDISTVEIITEGPRGLFGMLMDEIYGLNVSKIRAVKRITIDPHADEPRTSTPRKGKTSREAGISMPPPNITQ